MGFARRVRGRAMRSGQRSADTLMGAATGTGPSPAPRRRSLSARQRLARRARWRRWAAALLAAAASAVAVSAVAPRATQTGGREVVVAVRDLAAGAVVTRDDVEVVARPEGTVPETGLTAYADVIGRTTATVVSSRDVLTAERLVGAALLAGQPPGSVAMSVPVLDVGDATRPGARVDLYTTAAGEAAATDVVVLAVRRPTESAALLGGGTSPQLTVALDAAEASAVARSLSGLDGGQGLVVAVRPLTGPSQ
ncbi:SAF domain-containing protein [Humibacillus xanthopallidus]|nr:SAF domain-containing protein [Humibacillus xanthopallidus]